MAETPRFGRVVMWNLGGGWGVIRRIDDDQQYLCGASAVEGGRPLSVGQAVTFVPSCLPLLAIVAKNVRVAMTKIDAPL
jgi:hypothetical protein